jgi:hypothetical protein
MDKLLGLAALFKHLFRFLFAGCLGTGSEEFYFLKNSSEIEKRGFTFPPDSLSKVGQGLQDVLTVFPR